MKQWTTHAEQRLTEYLRERTDREGLAGEDAVELKEDLRSHIHEEVERSPATAIGLMELEHILGRLDAGYRPQAERAVSAPKRGGFKRFLLWTFGVVLPAAVLIFELATSMCGGVFFDPVPTWWHAVWIALVPGVNAWLLRGGRGGGDKLKGAAVGFVGVTAWFYGLLFLPLIHLSVIAILFVGMGFLSLTPVLAVLSTWRIGRAAGASAGDAKAFKTGWLGGVAASLLILVVSEAPSLWTRINLTAATAENADPSAAISRLRTLHSERALLKACYEGNRGTNMATDISGWMLKSWQIPAMMVGRNQFRAPDSEKVRDVFFRVTGKPFNSLKPPDSHRGGRLLGRVDPLEDIDFDDHLGGDDVAVRLKHLDLAESRFDGHVDSVSRIGYGEWTMVFKNGSAVAKEARCQVRLPRGGRVSRLTLWVNGEPREAAFSTVSKVKAAYKAIAVVQRRDPVLVNVVGPDTVMVQCFPVPPHGEMKIRLGVTAPLDKGRWELPHIIERNFGTLHSLKHALWMQGDGGFELIGQDEPMASHRDGGGHSLPATLDGMSVMDSDLSVLAGVMAEDPPVVWCEDRFAKPEERYLIREPVTVKRAAAGKPILVIDGSVTMSGMKERLIKAIKGMPPGEFELLLADDQARRVSLDDIETYRFSGGRDNEAALREGIRLANESGGPVVWIHGPQAIGLSQSEALLQLLERGTVKPVIYEVEAVTGPNRLAEAIYRTGCLHRGPDLVSDADLSGFLNELRMERVEHAWNWKRSATSEGLTGTQVWDHLARSWAAATAEDRNSNITDSARSEMAARYQLVTLFSGAVVLETEQQYKDHGLTPADGDATPQIPNVPEPSSSFLVMLAAAAALLRRKRLSSNPTGGTCS